MGMNNIDGEHFRDLVVIPGVGLSTANLPIPRHFAISNSRSSQFRHNSSSSRHPTSEAYLEWPAAGDPSLSTDLLLRAVSVTHLY